MFPGVGRDVQLVCTKLLSISSTFNRVVRSYLEVGQFLSELASSGTVDERTKAIYSVCGWSTIGKTDGQFTSLRTGCFPVRQTFLDTDQYSSKVYNAAGTAPKSSSP